MKARKSTLSLFGLLVILLVCSTTAIKSSIVDSLVIRDYWPTNGWESSGLEEQNMNASYLEAMVAHIGAEEYGIDSVTLIRNGYLVYEVFFNGYNASLKHQLFSVTKSIVSALAGIAIDEGLIQLNQTVLQFFSNRTIENLDASKERITIEHLLSMSSGLKWTEEVQNTFWLSSDDHIQFVLDREMVEEPGALFNYCSGNVHLLSAILQNVTNQTTLSYAQEKIFNSLGIQNVTWAIDPQGIYYGSHGISLTPRDMAKFGFLYLNNGTWDGEQLVPASWVKQSSQKYNYSLEPFNYGYLWWLYPTINSYTAQGFLGQRIYVVNDYDFVIVITGQDLYYNSILPILVEEFILPAINEHPYKPTIIPPTSTSPSTQNTSLLLVPFIPVLAITFLRKRLKKEFGKTKKLCGKK